MKPKLTVVVPTLNRPELAKIAVDSILGQSSKYFCEIILSNNGANLRAREIFNSEFYKNKIIYLETKDVLPMTTHWEWASGFATGEYLMVLPDRRLLKQGAVNSLISSMENNQDCDACCCCDEWLFESGRLISTRTFTTDAKVSAESVLKNFEAGKFDRNCLPLGLNCILRSKFLTNYRFLHGKYFDGTSPDFRSAFNFLFTANSIYVISEPLMITTGFSLSNGGKAYKGDLSYLKSLGSDGEFNFMPRCFEGNVWGSIFEDYLRSKHFFKGDGAYKRIMSKSAMALMMTEEMIKVAVAKFSGNSCRHYLEVRRVLKACGWKISDDFRALKGVIAGLKQFLPDSIKIVYRYIYAFINGKKKDILRVAGFARPIGRTDA